MGHGSQFYADCRPVWHRCRHILGIGAGGDHRYSVVPLVAGTPEVFTVAAIIPMFPGINAYMAMLAVIKLSQSVLPELLEMLVSNFLRAGFVVGALSIGLSVPGLWLYRKRPRV